MSKSSLTSLMQYRFVKRSGQKSDDSNSDQSSVRSNDSNTQPPSQTSTQPPGTPPQQMYSQEYARDPRYSGDNSLMSSPGSPIFGTKLRLIDQDWGATIDQPSSSSSSPWLSKENGNILNGAIRATSNHRQYPQFSDSSEDDVCRSEEFLSNREALRQMFPSSEDGDIKEALLEAECDLDRAMDILIDNGRKGKRKRIRENSNDSVSDGEIKTVPRKRIKQIFSDSGDETPEKDSQSTQPYSLGSQRSDATVIYNVRPESPELTEDEQRKMKFMETCFKDKSTEELLSALRESNWNAADATITLSSSVSLKSATQATKATVKKASKKIKKPSALPDVDLDEESDYKSGNDSDDSIEDEGDYGKRVILDFFEDASVEELMATPGCSKKKSELIVKQRPFGSWVTMVDKFLSVKGLSYDLISGCREVIKIREVIKNLMKKCERISAVMEETVSRLIHSTTMMDDANQITKQPSNLNPSLQLKPFQMVGLNWLRIIHTQEINGILADEMGLGKTIQTIAFLAYLLEQGEMGPHIIIVPSSTIDNWIREAKVWCPTMKVLVYYGSQEDRRATRQYIMTNHEDEYNVIITTYNMCSSTVEDRALFKRFEFYYAVFDEGHLLKNMSSIRYQNLMKISAHRRLLLTGTPLQNNLLELMSLLCFVMPEMFIGKTEQLKRCFTMISKNADEKRSNYEQERLKQAKNIMKPFVLRRLKSEVMSQLPPKTEEIVYSAMIPSQQTVYTRLITNFSSELNLEGNESQRGSAMLMQLRKAANHPLLHRVLYTEDKIYEMAKELCEEPSHKARGALPKFVIEDMLVMSDFELHKCCTFYKPFLKKFMLEQSVFGDSGKFRELDERLQYHREKGDRVLLFSQFTSMLDIMEEFLKPKHMRYLRLDGSTPVPDRQRLIDTFNTDRDIFLFLLSTKAGGLGINLTSANVVILHDIDFNPYNDKQAEDRCHRVGQTRDVKIVRLVSKDTVEEAMLKCAQEKLKLEKDVISTDDVENETGTQRDVASILRQALGADYKAKS